MTETAAETVTTSTSAFYAPVPAKHTIAFTCGARETLEQTNLRIAPEFGGVRQAVQACFHTLNDPGGNTPTTVTVELGDRSVSVSVSQDA